MSEKEYILFCDESDRVGKYYSNAKEALYKTILGEIKKSTRASTLVCLPARVR